MGGGGGGGFAYLSGVTITGNLGADTGLTRAAIYQARRDSCMKNFGQGREGRVLGHRRKFPSIVMAILAVLANERVRNCTVYMSLLLSVR